MIDFPGRLCLTSIVVYDRGRHDTRSWLLIVDSDRKRGASRTLLPGIALKCIMTLRTGSFKQRRGETRDGNTMDGCLCLLSDRLNTIARMTIRQRWNRGGNFLYIYLWQLACIEKAHKSALFVLQGLTWMASTKVIGNGGGLGVSTFWFCLANKSLQCTSRPVGACAN